MKEAVFIRQNLDKWRQAETLATQTLEANPDALADAYIDVTSDLSFAQTHYRESRITKYLNALASSLHNGIYRYKRERWSRLVTFWTREVPDIVWQERGLLLASLAIFAVATAVGVASQLLDADFARFILGDHYVEMTLDNIARGKPMDVYNSDDSSLMFMLIGANNVRVAFLAFALGALTSLGPAYVVFVNGVMVGCFQTFFFQHGLLGESALAIWLHGTLEMSSLVVEGAAGLALGNAILFPGTYSRLRALGRGARRGVGIIIGSVPIIVAAAIIESYFTRHVEWSDGVRLAIIVLSAVFMTGYYIVLPYYRNHGKKEPTHLALQETDVYRED